MTLLVLSTLRKRPQPAKMKNEGAGESDDERKATQRESGTCVNCVILCNSSKKINFPFKLNLQLELSTN